MIEMEVLVRAAWAGIVVKSIPIGFYPPKGMRISHFVRSLIICV